MRTCLAICALLWLALPASAESRAGTYTPKQLHDQSTVVFEGTVTRVETVAKYRKTFPVRAKVAAMLKGKLAGKDVSFRYKHPSRCVIREAEFNKPAAGQKGTFYLKDEAGTLVLIGYIAKPAAANVLIPVKVGYAFVPSWRLGGPAFAREVFTKASREGPVVYIGKTVPRGMLVLRSLQKADGKLKHGQCAVRSKQVDITSRLQVIGAQYRKVGDNLTQWVPPDKLPKFKVRYEPLLPKEISFPGKQNCVLLYEVGEGRKNEWREGYWVVSFRFDVSSLNMRLRPQGTGAVADPAKKKEGLSVIYQVRFLAKTIRTEADKQNLLYYTYLDRRASGNHGLRKRAIEPLGELIRAYPSEANLLYARAELLGEGTRYAEAIKDLDRIEVLVGKGTLRSAFTLDPGGERMSKKQVISALRSIKRIWSNKAAATTRKAKPFD